MERKLSAGEEVSSYCTRCKLDLTHIVIAMVGQKIVKVQCRTCGSIHGYRNREPVKRAAGGGEHRTGGVRKSQEPVRTGIDMWEAGMAKARGRELPYDMGQSFEEGDIIAHPSFGKGVVLRTHYRKCDVLFRDRERALASANI
ncbi:MAG: hypothetical protein K8I29_07375 [Alphaproteobacteria bacterium]|uniref:Uncharacterized protein n=1 Tax=Candidatus Nitrobium versatile TaxID=2884831 RepID=A0A953J5I1_9BACT|nr:hypothetical protein [Candidatus Nitrobium versatile]